MQHLASPRPAIPFRLLAVCIVGGFSRVHLCRLLAGNRVAVSRALETRDQVAGRPAADMIGDLFVLRVSAR